MTEIEAQKLVTMLVTAFAGKLTKLTPEQQLDTARVYRDLLQDLDSAVAAQAVRRLIQTSTFMPSIAEIREACHTVHVGSLKPGGDAWGEVLKAIGKFGVYRTPGVDFQFSDPLVLRVVDSFSWVALCSSENQIADRARFIELYDSLATTGRIEHSLPERDRLGPDQTPRGTRSLGEALRPVLPKGDDEPS